MSTLKVTNIQATGETASRAVSGVAAAWVNFNGTGTIAARDSVNVASLTDNGTGDYSVNLSNSFSTTDYSMTGSIKFNSGVAYDGVFSIRDQFSDEVEVLSVYGGTLFDSTIVSVTTHGDLA